MTPNRDCEPILTLRVVQKVHGFFAMKKSAQRRPDSGRPLCFRYSVGFAANPARRIFACRSASRTRDKAPSFFQMDKILPLLRKNARASIADLAKASGLGEADVAARIAKLEHDGVVLGYQAIVDPEKTAKESVTSVIEVKLTPERDGGFNKLAERISKFPEVQSCYLMSGGYDLMVVVEGRTLHEVAGFVSEKLSTMKGVVSTATHFRLRAYKENGVELKKESGPERLSVAP
jgi:DNA-binding Lrp family transcriptional regulator